MNALMKAFPNDFSCLGFFSNQFGHQTNVKDYEVLDALAHVRPGKGFKASFPLFGRVDVNGEKALPLFAFLKAAHPIPSGPGGDTIQGDPKGIIWSPVRRNDVAWNFEKFLVNRHGVPVKRYSHRTPVADIKADIEALLKA